jgi:hypothetical protein
MLITVYALLRTWSPARASRPFCPAFDKGSARGAIGKYPRTGEVSLAGFAAKIRSYCDRGDPICALGHNLAAHFGLTVTYNQTASRFVLGRLRAAGIS